MISADVETWEYLSSSSESTYTVTRAADGCMSCTCRGWTFKRGGKPRECKHTLDVIATGGFVRVERDSYVFAEKKVALSDENVLTSSGEGSIIIPVSDTGQQEMTTMTTAALHAADKINGMKASGMTAGKFGHVLDADGYVIPEKFDATFANGKWVMDEKFDGHRDQIVKLGDDVRHTLKSVALPEHLRAAVAQVPFDVVLDGELRIPGGISTDVPNGKLRAQLEFVAFDVISLMGDDVTHLTYTERRELLEAVAVHFAGTQVVLATQYPVTFANVRAIWARNGEGVILKLKTSTYRQGYRSGDWLKVKRLEHHTVTVTGFEAGSLGPTAVVNFRFDDGATGQCKNLNNEELARTAAAPESFIGAKLVVQCQQRTRGGAARHPMFDHWAGEAE